jgi:large subunit ribosomal protein L29
MNTAELQELESDELMEALHEAREEKFNLRFQVATNQLDNTARIRAVKKDIARILTEMRQRASTAPASTEAVEAGKEIA